MTETPEKQIAKQIGRNEPCPCGSGKKYKRCCGVSAAPKLGPAPAVPTGMPGGGNFEQFRDQMDPQAMQQVSQALGRLPKAQLQKLQNIMQRAMAGKDVAREAQEFEHSLPAELQSLLQSIQMPGMPAMDGAPTEEPQAEPASSAEPSTEMNEEEARRIVAAAAKEGKISSEEATELLEKPKGKSGFWKKLSGKS